MIQQHYELKNLLVANSFPQVPIITHKIGIYGKGDGSGRTLRRGCGWRWDGKGNLPQLLAKVKIELLLSVRSALTTEVVSKALVESATPCHDAQCGALPSIEPCLPD